MATGRMQDGRNIPSARYELCQRKQPTTQPRRHGGAGALLSQYSDLLDAITVEPELETQELSFLFMNLDEIVESGEISAAESHRFNQEQ